MSESFFDKMFGKKAKKDEKSAPAPAPTPAPAADAANGLKFLANPKKATNKRVEDAEKAAGMKCGGKVKKMAFGGSTGMPPRSMLQRVPLRRPMQISGGPMPEPALRGSLPRPEMRNMPAPVPGRPSPAAQRPAVAPQFGGGAAPSQGIRTDTSMPRLETMKKGGKVRGGGCATKGVGKGKMR